MGLLLIAFSSCMKESAQKPELQAKQFQAAEADLEIFPHNGWTGIEWLRGELESPGES